MKAEEHPLSQKPLIERITPGPWKSKIILKSRDQHGEVIPEYWYMSVDSVDLERTVARVVGHSKDVVIANAEAISRVPKLLKAEQELKELDRETEQQQTAIGNLSAQRDLQLSKIQELEETISRLQTGWIDVFAKQPPEHDDVLLLVSRADTIPSGVIVGHRANGTYYDQDGSALGNATHWMDLPKKQ